MAVMAQPHEAMSLYELRELALRQQQTIESTHQMIINGEQRLKLLKSDQHLNHAIHEYDRNVQRLKESVTQQELKLRQLNALKAQVLKQRSTNANICSELESIRSLFNEKEKELSVALTKVDALTRQLDELTNGNTSNSYHINALTNAKHTVELDKLKQELLYRSKLSEQNGHQLMLKRGLLTQRQSDMIRVDMRISELQQRLARKRQINQQLSQQMHSNIIRANSCGLDENELLLHNGLLRSSVGHTGHRHNAVNTLRPMSAHMNIAAVEPVLRDQTQRIHNNEFESHINVNKDFIGCKLDPKYQTLPYNTKFGIRQLQQQSHYRLNESLVANQLSVSTIQQNDRSDANSFLNNDNNNNNHNNSNVSIITNINNTKPMTGNMSSTLEERPSPSGSSGSSDRASIPNINGITAYKLQQMHNNMNNSNSTQHPYQNVNLNMINTIKNNDSNSSSLINNKSIKQNIHIINNNNHNNHKTLTNSLNLNQNVIHSQSVPTNTQIKSQSQQHISSLSKVPPNTKPKPVVPPKPSVPVKPTPPPRQTPNHLSNAQIYNDTIDVNAYSLHTKYNNKIPYNLLTNTTKATINPSNTGYNRLPMTSLAIHKTYSSMNGKLGLMNEQLPHHCQQPNQLILHSYEDKNQSYANHNTSEQTHHSSNEITDGCHLNGSTVSQTTTIDTLSSLSSLSSSLSSQNNNDMKSMITSKSDENENTFSLKKNSVLNNDKSINTTVTNISNNNKNINNLSNDWHKDKRRPVVANNEIEKELALQVSIETTKSIDLELNCEEIMKTQSDVKSSQQLSCDLIKDNSKHMNAITNKIQSDLTQTKLDKLVDKDQESDINLIKDQPLNDVKEETIRQGLDVNAMIESNISNKDYNCTETANSEDVLQSHKSVTNIIGSKRVKGNLKCQQLDRKEDTNSSCNGKHPLVSRRVSFDPLALLLDAALEGELELVKRTAKEVPNPSAANDEGITALHNAICAGHLDIVIYLVDNGCDVNAQDSDGWTPLHCAASCNNLAMVKFLVERGACIFATTLSDEETAAEKCEEEEEGFDGCSQYLYGIQEKLGVLNNGQVFGVYEYESQNADELSFKDGDMVVILRKGDEQEREWWWATNNEHLEGYVPRNLLGLYPRVKPNKELQTIAEENNE
ncbi:type-2 histone deacetylase 1-like [Oppia nitens]|uniref:type-2 histone deacetylase 1-like n=1 Tax=Oppia nitens TaxID=1686743 RepID=UPI0023DC5A2F|nr:type-2 histone deacetylase 1-like [Oppia nitens]